MSLTTSEMTPADFAAVTNNNGDGFGCGGGLWWIIVLFIFAFCGWGNGAGFGGGAGGAADNYVLASDFATLQRQIDSATDRLAQQGNGIANGLCDGFYTQAQLVNGVNTNILQSANTLQAQLAQCCCDNKAAIADVNYNMAMNANGITNAVTSGFCNTNYNAATNTRDIIEAQNANTRAILDALNAQAIEEKNNKIAEQNQQIFAYQLQASQAQQNNYLVNQLRPCPVPAYNVPNPYAYNGCGCGC